MNRVLSRLIQRAARVARADGAVLYAARPGETFQARIAAGIALDLRDEQHEALAVGSELMLPVRDRQGGLLAILHLVASAASAFDRHDAHTLAPLLTSLAKTLGAGERDTTGFEPIAAFKLPERVHSMQASEIAQARLRRSEQNLRLLLDSVADGIVINRRGRFLYANQAAANIFGARTPAELLTRSLFDLIANSEHRRLRDDMQRAEAGEVLLSQRSARRLNGSPFTIEGRVRCFDYDNGPALVVLCRDVTETRAHEERLQLEDRLRAAGTLAAAIAHEISNPLTAVLGNLELLQRSLCTLTEGLTAEQLQSLQDGVQEAIAGADRINRIVRAMRTLVRDTSRVPRMPVALDGAIDAALNLTRNELRQRANIARELRPTPLVAADETRLTQVLVNLLTNAGQAIEPGRPDQHNIYVCSYTTLSGRAVVEVRDDGVGIPADQLKHIFEPFYTTKDLGEGTGLGLAIVHRIVSDLGGEINVTSKPGLGTTFRVELPAAECAAEVTQAEASARSVPQPPAAQIGRASHCVLIVDDEPAIVRLVSRMLQGHYHTLAATSGAQALQMLEQGGIDIILSDMMMPAMSGAQLYEAIVERHPELQERIIFMTGGAFTGKTREWLRCVSHPQLEKPMKANELLAQIKNMITRSEPGGA